MSEHEKVNILMVDDQPAKLLSYEVILSELGENLIKAGGVPYSIVRATQFFEFLGGIADSGAEGDTVRLSTAPMQPLAADDVAAALADVAVELHGAGLAPMRSRGSARACRGCGGEIASSTVILERLR